MGGLQGISVSPHDTGREWVDNMSLSGAYGLSYFYFIQLENIFINFRASSI